MHELSTQRIEPGPCFGFSGEHTALRLALANEREGTPHQQEQGACNQPSAEGRAAAKFPMGPQPFCDPLAHWLGRKAALSQVGQKKGPSVFGEDRTNHPIQCLHFSEFHRTTPLDPDNIPFNGNLVLPNGFP